MSWFCLRSLCRKSTTWPSTHQCIRLYRLWLKCKWSNEFIRFGRRKSAICIICEVCRFMILCFVCALPLIARGMKSDITLALNGTANGFYLGNKNGNKNSFRRDYDSLPVANNSHRTSFFISLWLKRQKKTELKVSVKLKLLELVEHRYTKMLLVWNGTHFAATRNRVQGQHLL